MAYAPNNITVSVMTGGKQVKVSVSRDGYVRDLIQCIQDQEGITFNSGGCPGCTGNIRLFFRGKALVATEKLSYYGVRHCSAVTVTWRVNGGGLANVWYKNGAVHVGGPQQRKTYQEIAAFSIPRFHVSCRSDKIKGQNMIGIVLYLCDNKQLFYLNGMKCRSGYILLVSADKLSKIQTRQGTMHSKAFKHFTNKDLTQVNIVGGGFGLRNGAPAFNSGTFNEATTKFHDGNRAMHIIEQQCITAAINNWKNNIQNTNVSDLCSNGSCFHHGFY